MSEFKFNFKPFQEALLKRRAQASTVIIFKNSDPKRLVPFIKFVHKYFAKKSHKIYVYKVWSGLFEACFTSNGEVYFEPVSARSASSSPLLSVAQPSMRIRELNAALAYIDNAMENETQKMVNNRQATAIIAIFYGLFSYGNVSQQELYNFIKFLRNAIFSEEHYACGHTIVVFTDSPEAIIDDDTLKHSILVEIPPSTDGERKAIISEIANAFAISFDNGTLESLAAATRGLNLHETESVALESMFKYRRLDPRVMTAFKYEIVRKSGILDIEQPQHGFEAVGGYEVVKEFIRNNIIRIIRNPKKAERLGIRPPRGILFFGLPGTGKTWFAKALAKELKLPFLRFRTEKIVSKWYGETSRNIAKAIEVAEAVAPCVVFIDEIDRFGRRGHLTEHEESRRAFSILLEWLGDDRRKTIVIGTTNRPEDLDEAFRRVGRFDYLIPFLLPDFNARLQILKVHTSIVRKVPLKNVNLGKIAEDTEMWTGAELEELVLRAARYALREDANYVAMRHFEKALATFRINYEQRKQQLQRYLQLAEQFTNDAEFLGQLKKTYVLGRKTRTQAALEELKQ